MTTTSQPSQQDLDQRVQACLANEDDEAAFACIAETVQEAPAQLCRPHLVMLTQQGCPFCEEERQSKAKELAAGIIEEVDIHTDRGIAIAARAEVDFTPAVLLLDCQDQVIEQKPQEAGCETPKEKSPAEIGERLNAAIDHLYGLLA